MLGTKIARPCRILVLKDGQIVEQGSHTELIAQNGLFATMWANQITSADDVAPAVAETKEEVAGYSVEQAEPVAEPEAAEEAQAVVAEQLVDTPEAQPAELPTTGDVYVPASAPEEEAVDTPAVEQEVLAQAPPISAPIAFPSSELETPSPVAFPTTASTEALHASDHAHAPVSFPSSDKTAPIPMAFPTHGASQENIPSVGTQSPGVTFSDAPSPARSGTPDLDHDGKRRRTLSTQGIQRLARRISISRQGSVSPSLPAAIFHSLKRGESSKRDSKESSRDEGSPATPETGSLKDGSPISKDSPDASVSSDTKGKKKDKKKEKKRKSTHQA